MVTSKKKIAFMLLLMSAIQARAETSGIFPESLLKAIVPKGQEIDLSFLNRGLSLAPGFYDVDVYINKRLTKRVIIEFAEHNGNLIPKIPLSFLKASGVTNFDENAIQEYVQDEKISRLDKLLEGATFEFDGPNLRLDLTIPQKYWANSNTNPFDVVSPDLWDYGVSAGLVNYSLNASRLNNRDSSNSYHESVSLWLDGQINLGRWRLFSSGSFEYRKDRGPAYKRINNQWNYWNTYLQTDVPSMRSTLKIGDVSTSGHLFDTFSMRGIHFSTNEQMLPLADRSYTPTVSGYANTYAQIFIHQNKRLVYQTNVPPGPWVLNDLPANLGSGDLEVTVREADGQERVEVVSFNTVPLMLRPGQFRYDFNLGKYHYKNFVNHNDINPWFAEFTASYGLPWNVTLLGGVLINSDYQAYSLGSALSLGRLGALSLDITQSYLSEVYADQSSSLSGTSYRLRYEKQFDSTGTDFNLTSYRYSTRNYRSFADIFNGSRDELFDTQNLKHRWQIALSQQLGSLGQIHATANFADYYDHRKNNKTWTVSFSRTFFDIGTHLTYSRAYFKNEGSWEPEERIMLNLHIPLGKLFNERTRPLNNMSLGFRTSYDNLNDGENVNHLVSLNYSDPTSPWYWNLSQSMGDSATKESMATVGFNGERLSSTLSYARNKQQDTYQFSAVGGAVVHEKGITFSSRIYDAIAIVEVPDVSGVKINQYANVHTDKNGFAVVTNLRNYSSNELSIDPTTLPYGALLTRGTNQVVYPTSRSVTRLVYPVRLGSHALMFLNDKDGQPLPFGTSVIAVDRESGEEIVSSIVADGGRTYFAGIPTVGCIKVLNSDTDTALHYSYQLPMNEKQDSEILWMPKVKLMPSDGVCPKD